MKNIKNKIMSAAAVLVAGFGFSSCDIDMLPLNEVVLENFWTDRNDVESVVNSCYDATQQKGYLESLIVWGEDRSDNVVDGNTASENLRYLLKGSLKTTNPYCSWASMYNVINRCNTVLEFAPIVAEKDPNYTDSDLRINIAECKFLRAYTYFTLIKTFKDVPFTFKASIDDTQEYRLPQTPFEVILDSLIADIESCKDMAPRRYSLSERAKNTGRVTRVAMYSLLAELYLWKGSDVNLSKEQQNECYRQCIKNCDYVLNFKCDQFENNDFEDTDLRPLIDMEVYKEYGFPLLAEELTPGVNTKGPLATNDIFGKGGSYETIFELKYNSGSNKKSNTVLMDMYGESASSQDVVANEKMMQVKPQNTANYSDQVLFSVPSDYRMITSFRFKEDASDFQIYKYTIGTNDAGIQGKEYGEVGTSFKAATKSQSYRDGNNPPNWILYRMTEIMLFRAEAEIELAFNLDAANAPAEDAEDNAEATSGKQRRANLITMGSELSTPEDLKLDAFELISAVYRRSNPQVKARATYAPTQPTTLETFRKLLMNERRRELLFEGKRYYDLVRASRRDGNTQQFRAALSQKYGEAGASVAIKMIKMDFMYMPVLKGEMEVNPALVQNPCYLDEIENIKN